MNKKHYFIFLLIIFLSSCKNNETVLQNDLKTNPTVTKSDTIKIEIKKTPEKKIDTSDIEKIFINSRLINVQKLDSTIKVDLRYASKRNLMGFNMYGNIKNAYLQPYVAQKLAKASKFLHDTFPNFNLLIYDATRPQSIQQLIWDSIKIPESERYKFLSNPKYGSLHCFGAAVDITITDSTGNELNMGTDFDSFEELAYPILEQKFLKTGKLSKQIINNRKLLRKIMYKAGFFNIQTEWWHFNSCYRKEAREKYAMILNHKIEKTDNLLASNTITELNKSNIYFKIQIKTSKQKLSTNNKIFKNLAVNRYYHEGLYKYTVGKYKTLEQAYETRDKMRNLGYTDCFIAAFNNNDRIEIKTAIELLN